MSANFKSPLLDSTISSDDDRTSSALAVQPATAKSQASSPQIPTSNGKSASHSDLGTLCNDLHESVVRMPYDYVAALPSKGVREKLMKAFNAWFAIPQSSLEHITKAIAILHTASLLVDDIQDNSPLRRGNPAAHTIYGIPQTINSANYMYFMALLELQGLSNPRTTEIFVEELRRLHIGQGMDLFWRDTLQCPTVTEYFEMVSNKTGGLFRLAVKLMQAESTMPKLDTCIALVENLGILFQIRDDYQNLVSNEYRDQKGTCEDLTEGKFSYPVIHCIHSDKASPHLLQILKLRSTDDGVKSLALSYMEKTGSLKHTRDVILVQIDHAKTLIEEIAVATGGAFEVKGLLAVLESLAKGL